MPSEPTWVSFSKTTLFEFMFVTPFDDGPMTDTLWWLSMLWGFITSLMNVVWMLNYLSLFPIVLVKSFIEIFLLRWEMLKSLDIVLWKTGLGGKSWDQLLVNWFAHWGCHSRRVRVTIRRGLSESEAIVTVRSGWGWCIWWSGVHQGRFDKGT
jgi:hypothetical protein